MLKTPNDPLILNSHLKSPKIFTRTIDTKQKSAQMCDKSKFHEVIQCDKNFPLNDQQARKQSPRNKKKVK